MTNAFKAALARRDRAEIGLWLTLGDTYSAEVCASAGFDWLVVDAEHTPNDVRTILAHLQMLAGYDVEPVVRPAIGHAHVLKTLMDLGARTLLVPIVESGAQAADLVRAVHYPPAGIRGVGYHVARASRWTRDADYAEGADDDICLLVQVETVAGVDAIDDIAGTDGVDGVFVGPADLAAALGHLGEPLHPDALAATDRIFERVHAAGKAVGILEPDPERARQRITQGFDFVAVGADSLLLAKATSALVDNFR